MNLIEIFFALLWVVLSIGLYRSNSRNYEDYAGWWFTLTMLNLVYWAIQLLQNHWELFTKPLW